MTPRGDEADEAIVAAWRQNAQPWIRLVQQDKIPSRSLVTNQAVVATVMASLEARTTDAEVSPVPVPKVLDLGCGEGWLCRELARRGLQVTGVDAVPALIEQARRSRDSSLPPGLCDFRLMSYDDVAQGQLAQRYDALVCNFSLLGERSVERLFAVAHTLLNPGGRLIVQTLHPAKVLADQQQPGAWQEERWQGFEEDFTAPSPWFFRTTEQWQQLFLGSHVNLETVIEPRHPGTDEVMSLMLVGRYGPKAGSP